MTDLRYPIGYFEHSGPVTEVELHQWVGEIARLPEDLRRAVTDLDRHQLDTPYRPGGWAIRQVVHHLADSHMNSYLRFKWALTEDNPTIKPYDEGRWAELPDYELVPVGINLDMLDALHAKWVTLIRALDPDQLACRFVNPESGETDLGGAVGSYAWHGRHHLAHIRTAIDREGWT